MHRAALLYVIAFMMSLQQGKNAPEWKSANRNPIRFQLANGNQAGT
jgi:hypothetical protein